MEQQDSLLNFFHSLIPQPSREHGEEMLSIDARTLQKPDIKFD
jgi:hypothetical protein